MTQDSEDRIAKVVAHAVTAEHPAVRDDRARGGGSHVSIGLSLLLQLMAIAATGGGVLWKLSDLSGRWENNARLTEERIRVLESYRDQTQPILELVKAKLRLEGNGRGGR